MYEWQISRYGELRNLSFVLTFHQLAKELQEIFSFSGKSKEAEMKRINKELANIRSKFKGTQQLFGFLLHKVFLTHTHDSTWMSKVEIWTLRSFLLIEQCPGPSSQCDHTL